MFGTMMLFAIWVSYKARRHTKQNIFEYEIDPIEIHVDKSERKVDI
jgi:hypothetical protein